jgi:Tfp pilus assembly protein PilO
MSFGDIVGLFIAMSSLTGMVAIVARAILRYQEQRLRGRRDAQDPGLRAELEDLHAQLADQQDVRQRLAELEERLDFAERMLARARPERLTPGEEGDR